MNRLLGIVLVSWLIGASQVQAESPTYHRDIAPILWKNCAGCHRPGEIGPFSLLDLSRRRRGGPSYLAEITASRKMPPWKPEPGLRFVP